MWSDEVKRRDGNKCVLCGATEGLQAHHIKPVVLYPEHKNDPDNGITLCGACHKKQHGGTYYGAGALPIKGYDPDPEGRAAAHRERIRQEAEERRLAMIGLDFGWKSKKDNAAIILAAAQAAGQTPKEYITEAISRRLVAEGYGPI